MRATGIQRRRRWADHLSAFLREADLDDSGHFLETDRGLGDPAQARERKGGADIRMAGERHLGGAVEDPNPRRVGRILGRKNERGLAIVQLGGEGLHRRVIDAARIGKYRKGIASEARGREHVDRQIVVAGHSPFPLRANPAGLPAARLQRAVSIRRARRKCSF